MFIRRKTYDKLVNESLDLKARVKQLEELLCPCESHKYELVESPERPAYPKRYICTKCRKVVETISASYQSHYDQNYYEIVNKKEVVKDDAKQK